MQSQGQRQRYIPEPDFLAFIKGQENFLPQALEKSKAQVKDGNTHSIGYGHDIKPTDPLVHQTITEEQATQLLLKDLATASERARWIFDDKFGRRSFEKLSKRKQEMLIDFAFNMGAGGLKIFPIFMTAVKNGDFQMAKKECIRHGPDENGVMQPLGRNQHFIARYFDGGLFKMKDPVELKMDKQQIEQQQNQWNAAQNQVQFDPDSIVMQHHDYPYQQQVPEDFTKNCLPDQRKEREEQLRYQSDHAFEVLDQINQAEEQRVMMQEQDLAREEQNMQLYEEEIQKIDQLLEENKEQEEELKKEIDQKEEQIKDFDREVEKLEQEREQLEAQKAELEQELREAQQEVEKRLQEIAQMQQMKAEDQKRLEEIKNELEDLRDKIRDLEKKISELTREIQQLEREIQTLQKEINDLKILIQKCETELVREQQEEESNKRNEENCANKINSLQNKKRGYEIAIAAAKAAIACLCFFAKALAAFLYAQISTFENMLKGTEAEIAQTQKLMEEYRQKKIVNGQNIQRLRDQINLSQQTLAQKEQELSQALETKAEKEEERRNLQADLESAKEKQAQLTQEMRALVQKIADTDQKLKTLEAQVVQLNLDIKNNAQSIVQANDQIEAITRKREDTLEEIKVLNDKKNDLKRAADKLKDLKGNLQTQVDGVKQMRAQHQDRKVSLNNAIASKQTIADYRKANRSIVDKKGKVIILPHFNYA